MTLSDAAALRILDHAVETDDFLRGFCLTALDFGAEVEELDALGVPTVTQRRVEWDDLDADGKAALIAAGLECRADAGATLPAVIGLSTAQGRYTEAFAGSDACLAYTGTGVGPTDRGDDPALEDFEEALCDGEIMLFCAFWTDDGDGAEIPGGYSASVSGLADPDTDPATIARRLAPSAHAMLEALAA